MPDDWTKTVLAEVLEGPVKNGYSPNAADKETGYWVLGLGALGNGGLNLSEAKPVTPTDKVIQNLLSPGDFLISRSNTPDKVGRSVRFTGEIDNCSYPDLMMRFRIDPSKAEPGFIEYTLKSFPIRCYLRNSAAGSSRTMVKINKSVVEKMPLDLPPMREQKRIAQILATWDKAITITEQLLANSQHQKKTLMQRLLTGTERFLGFSGEPKRTFLATIAKITMGSSPKSEAYNDRTEGLPLLQGNADIRNRLSAPRTYTSQVTKQCYPGDILLSVRAPVGEVSRSIHHACIGRGIAAIKANVGVDQELLYQWLLNFELKWLRLSQGSTFESVNSDDIKNITINLPDLKEQQKIAAVLAASDAEVDNIEKILARLKAEKNALMQQLLTGKRRVKVDEEQAA